MTPPGGSQGKGLPFTCQVVSVPLLGVPLPCSLMFVFVKMSLQTYNLRIRFSKKFKSSLLLCEKMAAESPLGAWRKRKGSTVKNGKAQCEVEEIYRKRKVQWRNNSWGFCLHGEGG